MVKANDTRKPKSKAAKSPKGEVKIKKIKQPKVSKQLTNEAKKYKKRKPSQKTVKMRSECAPFLRHLLGEITNLEKMGYYIKDEILYKKLDDLLVVNFSTDVVEYVPNFLYGFFTIVHKFCEPMEFYHGKEQLEYKCLPKSLLALTFFDGREAMTPNRMMTERKKLFVGYKLSERDRGLLEYWQSNYGGDKTFEECTLDLREFPEPEPAELERDEPVEMQEVEMQEEEGVEEGESVEETEGSSSESQMEETIEDSQAFGEGADAQALECEEPHSDSN